MKYGYARVSSRDQNLERQKNELLEFGIEEKNLYQDKESGCNFNRTNYNKLRKKLKFGDLLVIKSIDRLGRNYDMIIEEWAILTKTIQCDIVVLDMDLLDTRMQNNTLLGKFIADIVLQVLSFVAENERTNIKTRQAEGIKIAKEKGVKFGRPSLTITPSLISLIKEYHNDHYTFKEILSLTKMSRGSFYKYYSLYKLNLL